MMNRKNNNKNNRYIGQGLTAEEQKKFTKFLLSKNIEEEPYRNIFLLQMYLGLSLDEILSLKYEDIDLDNNLININKTLSKDSSGNCIISNLGINPRCVPIPPFIKDLLLQQKELSKNNENNLLFTFEADNDIINYKLYELLKECGIKSVCNQELRNTYVRRLAEIGVFPAMIDKWLGIESNNPILKMAQSQLNKWENNEISKVNQYYKNNNFFDNSKIKTDCENEFETVNQEDLEKKINWLNQFILADSNKQLLLPNLIEDETQEKSIALVNKEQMNKDWNSIDSKNYFKTWNEVNSFIDGLCLGKNTRFNDKDIER